MEFVDRVTLSTLGPAAEMFARHASPAFMTFQYFPKTAIAVPRGIVNTTIAARRCRDLEAGTEKGRSLAAPPLPSVAGAGYLKIQLAASITATPASSVR